MSLRTQDRRSAARGGRSYLWGLALFAGFCLVLVPLGRSYPIQGFIDLWLTPDQQGDRMMREGRFAEAAERYRDPMRIGAALISAKDFKAAVAAFGRLKTADANYNRGNALVMTGKYEDAVTAYDTALKLRPGWPDAEVNRTIAQKRAEALKLEGGDMTGGQLAPDEIVFGDGKKKSEGGEEETTEGGEPLSDQELQAMWLHRIQTRPADFLQAKFAFQAQQQGVKK